MWLKALHEIGLTNLSDAQVERYLAHQRAVVKHGQIQRKINVMEEEIERLKYQIQQLKGENDKLATLLESDASGR